jgi:hypothetical protein
MMTDSYYPLYLDPSSFNPLLDLHDAGYGMASFATAVGLRPQDLFGTCLAIFLMLAAGIIVLSLILWTAHGVGEYLHGPPERTRPGQRKRNSYGSSPNASIGGGVDISATSTPGLEPKDGPSLTPQAVLAQRSSRPSKLRRTWLRFRPKGEAGAFHAAAVYGNLLRLILIFHLPITTFSIYHLVLGSSASIVSRVFAGLAFVFISILIPAGVLFKISSTNTGKLYDATRTLLALGPMYNVYVEDKQMFRVFPLTASLITGIVVGAGQKSGIAQAVILVLVELVMLIVPAIWYPWGEGASMGAPSTFLGVIRVASMVLIMILSPTVSSSLGQPVCLSNIV